MWRARLVTANRRSPISSSSLAGVAPPACASTISAASSAIFSTTFGAESQSRSYACGSLLQLHRTQERGQGVGTVVKQAAGGNSARSLRLCSSHATVCSSAELIPPSAPKTCGCRRTHLARDGGDNIAEIEEVLLLGHARVKHHLKQGDRRGSRPSASPSSSPRSHRRLRRLLQWCRARCSQSSARHPTGNRHRDRADVA